jgi:predicted RNA-binding protein YlqC (UPF0109 family)
MSDTVDPMVGLLKTITESIGRSSSPPVIRHFPDEAKLQFSVDPADQGRIVGKKGCVIWAIQVIMWYAGMAQLTCEYQVELLEPEAPYKGLSRPFRWDPKWNRSKIMSLATAVSETCLKDHANLDMKDTGETSATIFLKINKYLQCPLLDPPFCEAFQTIVHAAGMSNGVDIKTEVIFE